MMKYPRIPAQLIALTDLRRAESREVGVPLYLPATDFRLIEEIGRLEAETDGDAPVEAGGLTIGDDEDDDFY